MLLDGTTIIYREPEYPVGTRVLAPNQVYTEEDARKNVATLSDTTVENRFNKISHGILQKIGTKEEFEVSNPKDWFNIGWFNSADVLIFSAWYTRRTIWTRKDLDEQLAKNAAKEVPPKPQELIRPTSLFTSGTKVNVPKTAMGLSVYKQIVESDTPYLIYHSCRDFLVLDKNKAEHFLQLPGIGGRFVFRESDGITLYEESLKEKPSPKVVQAPVIPPAIIHPYQNILDQFPDRFNIRMTDQLLADISLLNRTRNIFNSVSNIVRKNPEHKWKVNKITPIANAARGLHVSTLFEIEIPDCDSNRYYITQDRVYLLREAMESMKGKELREADLFPIGTKLLIPLTAMGNSPLYKDLTINPPNYLVYRGYCEGDEIKDIKNHHVLENPITNIRYCFIESDGLALYLEPEPFSVRGSADITEPEPFRAAIKSSRTSNPDYSIGNSIQSNPFNQFADQGPFQVESPLKQALNAFYKINNQRVGKLEQSILVNQEEEEDPNSYLNDLPLQQKPINLDN